MLFRSGTADLVPGVSGGTIALITGIYARLLAALSQANGETVMLLVRGRFARCWERIDGSFLLVLAAGMGTAIVGFAEGIQFLLAHYSLVLWSFFFGLVLGLLLPRAGGGQHFCFLRRFDRSGLDQDTDGRLVHSLQKLWDSLVIQTDVPNTVFPAERETHTVIARLLSDGLPPSRERRGR